MNWPYFDLAPYLGAGYYLVEEGVKRPLTFKIGQPVVVADFAAAERLLATEDIRGTVRNVTTQRLNHWGEPVTKRETAAWLDGYQSGFEMGGPYDQGYNPYTTFGEGIRQHVAWREGFLAGHIARHTPPRKA